jgi:hypothetical protein
MQILRIQYARVPKIQMLNHRFRPDAEHLIVTLDVDRYDPPETNDFYSVYHALSDLFPTLSRHECCEQWENTPLFLQSMEGVSIKSVGEAADIAHLVEHVIVDLQCAISGMRLCSGITCGHRNPENRFDIFVECADPRVGAFSARLAAYLVSLLLNRPRVSLRYRDLVTAARLVGEDPGMEDDLAQLSQQMHRCPAVSSWAVEGLKALGFIQTEGSEYDHSANNKR